MKEFDCSSRESQNLIVKMLNKDPENRISIEDSLNHKFFTMNGLNKNYINNVRKQPHRSNEMPKLRNTFVD